MNVAHPSTANVRVPRPLRMPIFRRQRDTRGRLPAARGDRRVVSSLAVGGWVDGEFVLVDAELLGIGGEGITAVVYGAVGLHQPVWLRLEGDCGRSFGAAARVLGATWLRSGRCAVRLALGEDCPAGFFEALVARLAAAPAALCASASRRDGAASLQRRRAR